MKKNRIIIIALVCLIGFGSIVVFVAYNFLTFDKRKISEYVGMKDDYQVVKAIHDNHQWYVKLDIKKTHGMDILKRHDFKYGILDMRGVLPNDYIHYSPNGWYYIDKVTRGSYGYLVIYLNSEKTQLEMYELFNN